MEVTVQVSLPREARCVPMMRDVATCLLDDVAAPQAAVDDLRIAVTEACANVVLHATGSDEYSVTLVVDDDGCEVEVVDLGPGFTPADVTGADAEQEAGRGLGLIAALVDDLEFDREDAAMRVRLMKRWEGLALASGDGLATRG